MKIGASTLATFNDTLEDSLEFIESLGIKYSELLHQYPHEKFDLDILNSFNLRYTIHAPFIDVNIASLSTKSRLSSIEQIKDSIKLANEIDASAVVVHPGLVPFLLKDQPDKIYEIADNSIKELGEYSHDLGVNTTIENMPAFESMIYQDMNRLNETLEKFDMAMTFDIGHAHHSGISPDNMYFDSIKHIHAHDNFGDDDTHLPLGEGNIELKRIIDEFEKKNYDGIYMIEVNDKDSIKKSLEFLKTNF
ncbi:MAG: sugar phosphate isomerase/epimerase [Methanobrevibacter sp.]|nr:sugar phosphate isomerase/epimerase [Methanobrevibacter sp.]